MLALQRSIGVSARLLRLHSTENQSTKWAIENVVKQYRADLMSAMRAKDTPRANVIRAVTNEISNGRLAKPIKTYDSEMDFLTLLRQLASKRSASIAQFTEAKRQDLIDKEQAELDVLNEYAGKIKTSTAEEISAAIERVLKLPEFLEGGVTGLRKKMPDVLQKLNELLQGRVTRGDLVEGITRMIGREKK